MTDTNNTDGAALLPVTAEAREHAARWAKLNSRSQQAANIRRGSCDTAPIVQAFARFERDILTRAPLPATQEDGARALSDLQRLGQEYDGEAVRKAALGVLKHRVGDLPHLGYIRDNDASRAAIARLSAALNPAQATPSAVSGEAGEGRECPNSPSGKHQVDTSMEEGPHHCFYCSVNMRPSHKGAGE